MRPMSLGWRVAIVIRLQRKPTILGQTGYRDVSGSKRNFRALIEEHARKLATKNLLRSLLVVQAAKPNLASIGKLKVPIRFI